MNVYPENKGLESTVLTHLRTKNILLIHIPKYNNLRGLMFNVPPDEVPDFSNKTPVDQLFATLSYKQSRSVRICAKT